MQIAALLALVSAVAAAALPTDTSATVESNLFTRANDVSNLPSKACQCGGKAAGASTYAAGDIKKAADLSLSYVVQNKQIGANLYPHVYGYKDATVNFPAALCARGQGSIYEFPITRGLYTGADPGPDRVVIRLTSTKKAVYCGLMTHLGVAGNSFQSCSC
ncbi:Ribonuclease/ribotoxin [Rhypophila decipiens]|uniref:ribonuclease T1 n=1 Tax=Rhypophila decipiens TaxID=261697 RepID=A0AAN7B1L9_9PEZI|nr:Ribonuclease/ribotoxin [Rhypophila decipiens]